MAKGISDRAGSIVFETDEELDYTSSSEDDDGTGSISYEPPEQLAEAHWHRRCIGDLVDMMKTPYIDLNPDYQRDVVWPPERMTKLIDSLMSRYYVPPVIFNVRQIKDSSGEERFLRISIDGKQRLTSIRDFVNGIIPCSDSSKRRWYFCDDPNSGQKRRILPQKTRREFLKKELLCAEFANLERRQEEDLFSRVQLGMPLTPAEKLRASSGKWQEFAIIIEKEYQELVGVVDNRRGRGFQLILQIFKQLIKSEDLDPTYAAGAAALKGFCAETKWLDDAFKKMARSVFDRYIEVFQKFPRTFEDQNYKHAKRFSPVEFVGVAVLIHRFPDRNARLLAQDILVLRKEIRERRQDLRSNTQTWKTMIEEIVYIESTRGGVDPSVLQPKVNRYFGSAEDGETGFGEISSSQGHISTQDATGQTPPRPPRTRSARKQITTSIPKTTATIKKVSTRSRAAPAPAPAPVPTPALTSSPSDAESQIKRESSSIIANGHLRKSPPPTASLSALSSQIQIPLFNDLPTTDSSPAPVQPSQRQRADMTPPPPSVLKRVDPSEGPPPYNNFYGARSDLASRFRAVPSQSVGRGGSWNGSFATPPARKRTREQEEQEKAANVKREKLGGFQID